MKRSKIVDIEAVMANGIWTTYIDIGKNSTHPVDVMLDRVYEALLDSFYVM